LILDLPEPRSLAARLATYFHARPGQWIDGRTLATVGGLYAWRSRVSELRRAPYSMRLDNRQRRVEVDGHKVTISEYRYRG
jgi:hypothetical protein